VGRRARARPRPFGPLIVVRTRHEAVTLGRLADPVARETYTIRLRFTRPARARRPDPGAPHTITTVTLGPHELSLYPDRVVEVSGRRTSGTRLEFAAPGLAFTPASVVLNGHGTYDLGRVRVQPRPGPAGRTRVQPRP
jgi:hypothetical protein